MEKFNVEKIRQDFPVLSQSMNGKRLVYLDNAATAQKPLCVLERMRRFDSEEYATVHRGVYTLSQNSTWECEQVREKCRVFLNAKKNAEIIFVSGATEAINLVAAGYGRRFLDKEDEILITEMEHHANLLPWQQLAAEKGAVLKVAPINDAGELIFEEYQKLLSEKTKIVAVTHMSNVLGTVNPLKKIIEEAHRAGAVVSVDGAQGAVHGEVDVQNLDCDFYCFSGHKMYGPTGVGVLYGKLSLLEKMAPYKTGGEMIKVVTFEKSTFSDPPQKFEAGTPPISQIIGLGAALDYLSDLGLSRIHAYEECLLQNLTEQILKVPGVTIHGTAKEKNSVVSFSLEDIHPHDIGTVLDQEGVAIRTGHHCAQPLMKRLNVSATARASLGLYNTAEDIRLFVDALNKVRELFA